MTAVLSKAEGGHLHWCEGCGSAHFVPDGWQFNGDPVAPSFTPSVRHTWEFGEARTPKCCHYFIRGGHIDYCSDCTHRLAGTSVAMRPVEDWP